MFNIQPEYVCDVCDRTFAMKHNLIKHIKNTHYVNDACVCTICKKIFESPLGLKRHLKRGHNRFKQSQPECDLCGQTFERKENIAKHLQTRHSMGPAPDISCETCGEKFTSERILKRHINRFHKPDLEFQVCDECDLVFHKDSLVAHILSDHKVSANDVNRCQLCDKVYSCHRNLKRHIVSQHGMNEEFKCIFCPKKLTSNLGLRRHIKTSHNVDMPREYSCDYCSKSFSQKPYLDAHISLQHRGHSPSLLKFHCECGKAFKNEPELRQHVKSEHNFEVFYSYCKNSLLRTANLTGDSAKQLTAGHDCEMCQEHFGSLYDLRIHLNSIHDIEFSLEYCNVCFGKFFSKEALIQHQKTCTAPENVKHCGLCDKLFTDDLSLRFHMKVFHSPEQLMLLNVPDYLDESSSGEDADPNEYKCQYCDKMFKTKLNLKKHNEYVHLGLQRYKCRECDSHFNERRNLRRHIRLKHPQCTLFPLCRFCRKRFESAKACYLHLRQVHSLDTGAFPCDLCSASYNNSDLLNSHMKAKHIDEEELFKCDDCAVYFEHDTFERHKEKCQQTLESQKTIPRCVICTRVYTAKNTLKRHIKSFHREFDPKELVTMGFTRRLTVDCKDCLNKFTDNELYKIYLDNKRLREFVIFKCGTCGDTYTVAEFAVERHKRMMGTRRAKRPPCATEVDTLKPSGGRLRAVLKKKLRR